MRPMLSIAVAIVACAFNAFGLAAGVPLTLAFACLLALSRVKFVPPGAVVIVIDARSGSARVLRMGVNMLGFFEYDAGSHIWRAFGRAPAPGSRVRFDPPAAEVHTSDEIRGVVDVAVDATVADWTGADTLAGVLRDHTDVQRRACEIVSRWLAEVFARVPAAQATYGNIVRELNEGKTLAALNEALLRDCHLRARSVTLDADGVKLSPSYLRKLGEMIEQRQALQERESVLRREAELEQLAREKERAARAFELDMERQRAEAKRDVAAADAAVARIRGDATAAQVKALVAEGVPPADAAAMQLAVTNAALLAEASRHGASVSLTPAMVGLGLGLGVGTVQTGRQAGTQ
eukprot:g7579.t1